MTVITAIGTANPPFKQTQQDTVDSIASLLHLKAAERRILKSIYKSTGIQTRYSVLDDFCKRPGEYEFFPNKENATFPSTAMRMQVYKQHALSLAIRAIENCLTPLHDFATSNITHLITVSCTGMYAPGLDIEIVQQLQLATQVKRTAINFMGCYGVFNALKVADAICRAQSEAKVLVVSVELCSLHFQAGRSLDQLVSNAIFADGAAAALIESQSLEKKCFTLQQFYCDLLPQSSHEMAWHVGDNGFDIVLSSYVPQFIQSGIADFASRLLALSQLSLADIDFYAIHPGGHKILKACELALSLTGHDNRFSYQVLQQYGNMSSATVLFVLKAIWETIDERNQHQQIFSCAFGPGLTLESMLLRIN